MLGKGDSYCFILLFLLSERIFLPILYQLRRVKEMVQHLQAERVRLANEVSSLEQSNESLKAQLAKTKEKAQQKEQVRWETQLSVLWCLLFIIVLPTSETKRCARHTRFLFCALFKMNLFHFVFFYVVQEREAVEGSDRSRVHALETLNTKLTSELEEVKREQDLKIVECETLKHDLKAVMQRLGEFNLLIYCVCVVEHILYVESWATAHNKLYSRTYQC